MFEHNKIWKSKHDSEVDQKHTENMGIFGNSKLNSPETKGAVKQTDIDKKREDSDTGEKNTDA